MTGRDSSAGGVTPVFVTARLELTVAVPDGSSPEDVRRLVDGLRARVVLSHEDSDLRPLIAGHEPDDLHIGVRAMVAPDDAVSRPSEQGREENHENAAAGTSDSPAPPELDFSAIGFAPDDTVRDVPAHGPSGAGLMDMSFPGTSDFAIAAPSGTASRDADSPAAQGVVRRAVIALSSRSTQAEGMFRAAVVSVDAIPGNQVDGISPLYHVATPDGPDAMAAVLQLTTRLDAAGLAAAIRSIASGQEDGLDLQIVDMEGLDTSERAVLAPEETRRSAAVLSPWLDMDANARLGADPVSYLLALAPDADRVGMLADDWILGGSAGPFPAGGSATTDERV